MPTMFFAVQCFQCSTMQVKQQKKSSNKWCCVVCNQKQSVRKVFAQSFMAKDVRKFVQNFNLSRQLSDQKQLLEGDELETFDYPSEEQMKMKKRNDWTEYVDDQEEEHCEKFDANENLAEGDSGLEPMVVTEMPKALFKKPKFKDYSSNGNISGKLMKPLFPNRSKAKRHHNDHSQDTQSTEFEHNEEVTSLHSSDRASKWSSFRAQIQDHNSNLRNMEEPFLRQPTKRFKDNESYGNGAGASIQRPHQKTGVGKGPVSKWSSFIAEEDEEDMEIRGRGDSWDRVSQPSNEPLESLVNVERVEDDIHPDFL